VTVAQQRTLEPSTPVLLLHGWIFQSDLNWYRTYARTGLTPASVRVNLHRGFKLLRSLLEGHRND